MKVVAWLVVLAVLLFSPAARAHKPSDSHLTVTVRESTVDVRWDLAIRDLDWAIGLDRDGDGTITWGELRAAHAPIAALATQHLALRSAGNSCALQVLGHEVVAHSDGTYAVLRLRGDCGGPIAELEVDYSMFFAEDPLHRGLLRLETSRESDARTEVFTSDRRVIKAAIGGGSSRLFALTRSGIVHIFTGYDHLLFLLALLLPAVLYRETSEWRPVPGLRAALSSVVQIVTAFTIAHSITLALGAFSVVSPPSRVVESAIAASVIVAALDNVFQFLRVDRWVVPFGLGLIHGFGFSSTLTDLGLHGKDLALALLGFNVGVELGQLACVLAFLPLAYAARRSRHYPRVALTGGSIAIAIIAAAWFVERAFAVTMPWSPRG